MLTVLTWLWGDKYQPHYVRRLAAAVKRNLRQPHRFICMVDRLNDQRPEMPGVDKRMIWDADLLGVPGCLARLRMFDLEFQAWNAFDDRIMNIDLDAVITGPLDDLADRPDDFAILQNVNTTNPCPFNGSLMVLRAGYRHDVWDDFSLPAASKVPFHAFPDDQGWLHHKIPEAGAFTDRQGVYAFKKKGWPSGDALPAGARLVAFPGFRDPGNYDKIEWIRRCWRLEK